MSERNTLYDIVRKTGFDFHDEYETLRAMVSNPILSQFDEMDVDLAGTVPIETKRTGVKVHLKAGMSPPIFVL